MLYAYFSLIFERISVKLGGYIGTISSISPMKFQVCTPNVMVIYYYFYFISFPLSAFCDFSVIFHRISLIFGQLVDNNL